MNTAAAPNTPAVPGSVPGTMRHASHAGLKARRLTSLRNGWNSLSPAWVTPPQITTTSGLKILRKLATAAPSSEAVSCRLVHDLRGDLGEIPFHVLRQ